MLYVLNRLYVLHGKLLVTSPWIQKCVMAGPPVQRNLDHSTFDLQQGRAVDACKVGFPWYTLPMTVDSLIQWCNLKLMQMMMRMMRIMMTTTRSFTFRSDGCLRWCWPRSRNGHGVNYNMKLNSPLQLHWNLTFLLQVSAWLNVTTCWIFQCLDIFW